MKTDGRPVLLLPAFSTVSTREEMRPLAGCLATRGFRCILVDWPGFGDSTRGWLNYGPRLYHTFLADFAATAVPPGAAVVAAGHAAAYVLALARDRPGIWSRVVLLAPTWRGRSRQPWASIRALTHGCADLLVCR